MWIVALVGFATMLYMCALPGDFPADTDDGVGLAGTYTVNGVSIDGVEYSGTVVIRAGDDPDTYELSWMVTGAIDSGRGVASGNDLTVEWQSESSAGEPVGGTGTYTIEADGRLVGTRTVDNVAGELVEELFATP